EKTAPKTTVKEWNEQIEKLKKRKAQLPREMQSIVDRLATSSATASNQVNKLSEAQEAVAAAVSKHRDEPDPLSDFAKKPQHHLSSTLTTPLHKSSTPLH